MEGEKPVRAGNEPGELGQTRRKLIDFLQTSDFYEPERLLAHFSDNSKWAAYWVMIFCSQIWNKLCVKVLIISVNNVVACVDLMVCVWVAGKTVWFPCYTRTLSDFYHCSPAWQLVRPIIAVLHGSLFVDWFVLTLIKASNYYYYYYLFCLWLCTLPCIQVVSTSVFALHSLLPELSKMHDGSASWAL